MIISRLSQLCGGVKSFNTLAQIHQKTGTQKMRNLPNKPSELLIVARDDLEKCIADGYFVRMGQWLSMLDGTCSVCLAGAVMAKSLGIHPQDKVIGPSSLRDIMPDDPRHQAYRANFTPPRHPTLTGSLSGRYSL